MRRAVLIVVLCCGCADTVPQAADRAQAAAVRSVADRYEAGEVTDATLAGELAKATSAARTKAIAAGFDAPFAKADKAGRVALLRQYADDAEPLPWWWGVALAGLGVGAGLAARPEVDRLADRMRRKTP